MLWGYNGGEHILRLEHTLDTVMAASISPGAVASVSIKAERADLLRKNRQRSGQTAVSPQPKVK